MPILGSFGAAGKGGFGRGGGAPYTIQYLVVAGGGSGGTFSYGGAGGGAGGYRTIASKTYEVVSGANYTVTVGAGGVGQSTSDDAGNKGNDSVFDTITSTAGGRGASLNGGPSGPNDPLANGGSGGGVSAYFLPNYNGPPGLGNEGGFSPPEGNNGGPGSTGGPPTAQRSGGGGGGASQAGFAGATNNAGNGGAGSPNSISGSAVTYSNGADGKVQSGPAGAPATANRGDGSEAGGAGVPTPSQNAGSGIVIIRRLTESSSTTSGTVTTDGDDTIHTFTGDGIYKG